MLTYKRKKENSYFYWLVPKILLIMEFYNKLEIRKIAQKSALCNFTQTNWLKFYKVLIIYKLYMYNIYLNIQKLHEPWTN